jgi:hypothetical protein
MPTACLFPLTGGMSETEVLTTIAYFHMISTTIDEKHVI